MLKILKLVGLIEGISFLVILFVTMPMKYLFSMPELNRPVGMVHGILFVTYVILVIVVGIERKWKNSAIWWSIFASVVPYGTFYADKKFFK